MIELDRDSTAQKLQPRDWALDDKTLMLYRLLISKLNKKVYDASIDIDDQHGVEVLRVITDKWTRLTTFQRTPRLSGTLR